jgi:hypothetical protein
VNDNRLLDRVADNLNKFDLTESESLLFGSDFGVATDIVTGPNGSVFCSVAFERLRVRDPPAAVIPGG